MKNWKSMLATVAVSLSVALPIQAQWQIPADPVAKQDYVAKLVATAQKPDAPLIERHAACRELAALGDKSAVPALAALLGDEKMSHMARYGLEPNPDPAVDEALRAALGQVKGKLLSGVIDSIGFRRDAKAAGALAGLLASPDADVAAAAAASLGRIGTAEAAAALEKAFAGASGEGLAVLGDGCVRAAGALCAAGKCDAAAAICDRVRASAAPRPVRMAATRGAILARGNGGTPLLIELLQGDDAGLAAVALRTSYDVSAPELTQALAGALPGLPADRQIPVLQALGNRGDASAVAAVIGLAANGSAPAEVRIPAIRAACQIGSASSLPALTELCAGSDPAIAAEAQAGLAGFPGAEADAAISKLMGAQDSKARCIGIDLAGQRRMASALPLLFKAAQDPDKRVSSAGYKVLADLGGPAEVPVLIDLLVKSGSSGAESALSAICSREGEAAAGALTGALGQAPVPSKQALLRVLRSAGGPKALAAVRGAAGDASAEVKDTATRVLCDWPSADAAADQLALAKTSTNPTYQILALRGYIRSIGDPKLAADQRQAMCREATALVQREAEKKLLLGALGNGANDAASLGIVMSHLGDPATSEEACVAAVSISERLLSKDPASVADPMRSVLKATKNEEILKRARRVLAQTRPKPASK